MLYLKTDEEVGLLRESNMLVSRTLAEIASHYKTRDYHSLSR